MTINKMVAYDALGTPYYFAIAESRRDGEDEIVAYIADNRMTYVKPF